MEVDRICKLQLKRKEPISTWKISSEPYMSNLYYNVLLLKGDCEMVLTNHYACNVIMNENNIHINSFLNQRHKFDSIGPIIFPNALKVI